MTRRVVAALMFAQLVALAALAQAAVPATAENVASPVAAPDEFGRVSGGELDVIAKHSSHFSGSFGVMSSTSQYPFSGSTHGYQATFGGTAVKDRVWFFAAAEQSPSIVSRFSTALPQNAAAFSRGFDAKASAQLTAGSNLSGSLSKSSISTGTALTVAPSPSNFFSMHFTGMPSANSFFSVNVTRSGASAPLAYDAVPAQ